MGCGMGVMAGMISVADVIKLCEFDAISATGGTDLMGRNAWARDPSPWDRLGIR